MHAATECAEQAVARWRGRPLRTLFPRSLSVPSVVKLLDEISPERSSPLFRQMSVKGQLSIRKE